MATKIKMEHVRNDIDLQVDNPSKNAANLIEWNVDMKVTVSNVRKSKMFQRSRTIMLFLLVLVFALVLSHLRKEVHALQAKVQSVNVNMLLLMSKYDRLNRNLNRVRIQRSKILLENRNVQDIRRLLEGTSPLSKAIQVPDATRNNNATSTHGYNSIVPYSNPARSLIKGEYTPHDDENGDAYTTTDNGSNSGIRNQLTTKLEDKNDNGDANLRIERAIVTLEKENSTAIGEEAQSYSETSDSDYTDDDYYIDEDRLGIRREPRSGRSRRDEGRGKKRGKNKRRPNRSHRRLGPLVATFVGAIPEQHVTGTGTVYIGPWVKSAKNNTRYSLNKFHLVEDRKSIEVTTTGLYMISAQIFYFGEPTNYSYWILLSSEGKSNTQKLVKCSTASSTSATEVSCYTSVITPLQRGDRVHIQQQERDRLINMREGHSYIQLVLLSHDTRRRRSSR